MKKLRTPILPVLIAVVFAGLALAQERDGGMATQSATFRLDATAGSEISGYVYIGEFGPNALIVALALQNTAPGGTHPAHIHRGDCGSGGGIEIPLDDVNGDTGLSVTLVDARYDAVTGSEDYHVNVHQSPQALERIVACGEVGAGARPAARAEGSETAGNTDAGSGSDAARDPGAEGAADTEPSTDEGAESETEAEGETEETSVTRAPSTASYGLFPVEGSDIRGQVQLTEDLQGGTKFVISLMGIEVGQRYAAALFEGDCGPDRPRVRELDPVGEAADDPYASVTETALDFQEITTGDHFIYIYRSERADEIAACGEVGAGANR